MTDFIKREKEALYERSKSVFVLPYPYKRGHFRIYENGENAFIYLDDSVFREAALKWNEIQIERKFDEDELHLLLTYIRLTENTCDTGRYANDEEKLILRLCMEGNGYCTDVALKLAKAMYPEYKRQNHDMWYLRAVFCKLFALYNDFFTKKL